MDIALPVWDSIQNSLTNTWNGENACGIIIEQRMPEQIEITICQRARIKRNDVPEVKSAFQDFSISISERKLVTMRPLHPEMIARHQSGA